MARQLSTKDVDYVVKYVLIEEKGLSGGNTKRPKFQELCRLVDSGQIDVVLSKEISRISRSTMDFCNFMDRCSKQNVAVHIKDLNVDPTTPMGGAMFKILAVVAELERELTRERTKSSLRSALVNNAKLNGGHIPLGFDPNPAAKGFWLINKEEIKQVEFLMTRFTETLSYKQTLIEAEQKGIKAKNGKKLTQDALRSLLENEKLIGIARTTWQGEEKVVQLRHGQAISPDLFSRVQEAVQKVSKDFKKNGTTYSMAFWSMRMVPLSRQPVARDRAG
jgi:site-specific DNA recombinase